MPIRKGERHEVVGVTCAATRFRPLHSLRDHHKFRIGENHLLIPLGFAEW